MKFRCFLLFLPFLITCTTPQPEKIQTSESIPVIVQPAGYKLLSKSDEMKDVLCQCWENTSDMEQLKGYEHTSDLEVPLRGYCFFKDGQVIKSPRGYQESGKWILDENVKPVTIKTIFKDHSNTFRLALLSSTSLKMMVNSELQEYSATGLRAIDELRDPFHPVNNKWRVKPSRAESVEQLKQRLKGCIHFYVLLYDQLLETNVETVSFTGYPSCFTWYSGGISLQPKTELQEKWINCFFNKKDALIAYEIAERLLKLKYEWPKEGNWLKLNVQALRQMELKIDSLH